MQVRGRARAVGHVLSSAQTDARPPRPPVVQPRERNIMDQRLLEQRLWDSHGVRSVRATLAQVSAAGRVDEATGALRLRPLGAEGAGEVEGEEAEVSVAYFRCGYTPADYPSESEWAARALIEHSAAVKCPTVAYHLAGTKRVQQVRASRERQALCGALNADVLCLRHWLPLEHSSGLCRQRRPHSCAVALLDSGVSTLQRGMQRLCVRRRFPCCRPLNDSPLPLPRRRLPLSPVLSRNPIASLSSRSARAAATTSMGPTSPLPSRRVALVRLNSLPTRSWSGSSRAPRRPSLSLLAARQPCKRCLS